MNDALLRLPAIPVDIALTPLDATIAQWITGICVAVVLIATVFALKDMKRTGSPVLLLLIIGGAFANLAEPFVDIVAACWHPSIGQNTIFEMMGRPMPLWLFPTYIAYFGVLPMLIYRAFSKGAGTRMMWLWFVVPVLADLILEESLMSLSDNLYVYYGNQPLVLHKFPLFWAAPNTMGVYLSAVAMTLFVPHLRGWRIALVPLSTLFCYAAATGLVALPASVVINSSFPFLITQLGGIACFVIAAVLVHGCTRLIASDSPFDVRKAFAPKAV